MTLTLTETVAGIPLGEMIPHYIECAFWASTGDDGEPATWEYDDLADEAMTLIEADLLTFARRAWRIAETAGWSPGSFAHDYFLTRNHHGAGFCDRGRLEGEYLRRIADGMGEMDLYVGDDGKVYVS